MVSGQFVGNHKLGANGEWAPSMRTGGKGYCTIVRGKKNKSEDTFYFITIKTLTRR
jgi:hypothetical protein